MRQLSEQQAYAAMFAFLANWYEMTKSDDIGALLGSMSLMANDQPLDNALVDDWNAAVEKALAGTVNVCAEFRLDEKAWGRDSPSLLQRLFSFIPRAK